MKIEVTRVEFEVSEETQDKLENIKQDLEIQMEEYERTKGLYNETPQPPKPVKYEFKEEDYTRKTSEFTIDTKDLEGIGRAEFNTTEVCFKSGTSIYVEESYETMNEYWANGGS